MKCSSSLLFDETVSKTGQMLPYKRAETTHLREKNIRTQRSVESASFFKADRQGEMCKLATASRSPGAVSHERDEYTLHRSHLLSVMKNVIDESSIPERAAFDKRSFSSTVNRNTIWRVIDHETVRCQLEESLDAGLTGATACTGTRGVAYAF
jgi:hypothetical protein